MFACNLFRIDRQVYYRRIKEKINKEKAIEVVSMINQVRKNNAQLGGKKSYHILMNDLKSKLEEINYLIYSELIIY
jgi:hypothetical protein